jgi:hypothetical protein
VPNAISFSTPSKYVIYIYHRVADTVTFDFQRRHGVQSVNNYKSIFKYLVTYKQKSRKFGGIRMYDVKKIKLSLIEELTYVYNSCQISKKNLTNEAQDLI